MESLSVNLDAYRVGADFSSKEFDAGNMSSEQLDTLVKAMSAGQLQGGAQALNPGAAQTNAGATKIESLESNLKNVSFKESDIKFWKLIPKNAAFNTVEEYNQLTSYGNERGGFYQEGELPEGEDSTYVRKAELVKFLGVVREVTHVAQLVRTSVGSLYQKEIENGIKWIMRKANRGLFHGDSAVVPEEYNSIYAQHLNMSNYTTLESYMTSPHVIDMRGAKLSTIKIEEAGLNLYNNFAAPDTVLAPPSVFSDFSTTYYETQRSMLNANPLEIVAGNYIERMKTQFGLLNFVNDIFASKYRSEGVLPSIGSTSTKAPSAPTAGGAPAAVVADAALSRFASADAGDYFYAVSAINRYGESALVQLGTTVTVAAGESVDLQFTATAGAYTPTAYVVYRSKVDPSGAYSVTKMYPILVVPATGTDAKRGSLANGVDSAAAGKVRDRNRFLPGTQEAMVFGNDSETIEFKQLAPIMKMDLARIAPSDRFMVLLYGTPILYLPSKAVRIINIGRD